MRERKRGGRWMVVTARGFVTRRNTLREARADASWNTEHGDGFTIVRHYRRKLVQWNHEFACWEMRSNNTILRIQPTPE